MRLLIVDDELSMREYLTVLLTGAGYEVEAVGEMQGAIARLREARFDLVISDMRLGSGSGVSVLRTARALPQPPEVILITAYGTPAAAVEAMREGAYDYICKPFDNEELKLLVQKALEKRALLAENSQLRERLQTGAGAIGVGQSEKMQALWTLVGKVAASRSTVLITGESGTGKELVARAIHAKSARAAHPFLPVNCAALNEGVLESELFGHVKGSFTGAIQDRRGLLVSAGEGTIFLDEIGEMPLATQVKLLRVLQERRVKPVGSSQEVPFQARVLAATHRRLDEEVAKGRFREDLLYRLNIITLELPALRERREDIPLLAEHFLARQRDELGRPELVFAEETIRVLSGFDFPGNVRQLENVVERAATLADGELLGPDMLPPQVRGEARLTSNPSSSGVNLDPGFSLESLLDDMERAHLIAALRQSGGQKTKAAQILGLSFRSFRYRLAKHGLTDREESGEVGTAADQQTGDELRQR